MPVGYRYTAQAERDESGWWIGTIPDLPGAVTQARRLDQLPDRLGEAVAALLDIEDTVELELHVKLPPEVEAKLERAQHARQAADDAAREASGLTRGIARSLVADGYSLRDAGEILGVSHQRIGQLVKS
jgi:predicted RNase H-like HicB family nuclease